MYTALDPVFEALCDEAMYAGEFSLDDYDDLEEELDHSDIPF